MKKLLFCLLLLSMQILVPMSRLTITDTALIFVAADQTYWRWSQENGSFKNVTKDGFINKSTALEVTLQASNTKGFCLSREVTAPNKTRWQFLFNPDKQIAKWFRNEIGDN